MQLKKENKMPFPSLQIQYCNYIHKYILITANLHFHLSWYKNLVQQKNTQKNRKITLQTQTESLSVYQSQSVDDSDSVSYVVDVELVSSWLPISLSDDPHDLWSSTGCLKNQYIILAVNVNIIFWFTWYNIKDS